MGDKNEMSPLISSKYKIHSHYLPGHGDDTSLDSWQGSDDLSLVKHWVEHHQLQETLKDSDQYNIHIGYSMGAWFAFAVGVLYPKLVDCLILISFSPGIKNVAERHNRVEWDKNLQNELEKSDSPNLFSTFLKDKWYKQPLFQGIERNQNFLKMINEKSSLHSSTKLAQSMEFLSAGKRRSFWSEVEHYNKPLILIVGEKDTKYLDLAETITSLNPQIEKKEISKCSHMVHFERPDEVRKVIEGVFQCISRQYNNLSFP